MDPNRLQQLAQIPVRLYSTASNLVSLLVHHSRSSLKQQCKSRELGFDLRRVAIYGEVKAFSAL